MTDHSIHVKHTHDYSQQAIYVFILTNSNTTGFNDTQLQNNLSIHTYVII